MRVVLFGDINVDHFLYAPLYPAHGDDVIVERLETRLGGSVTNTAIVLQKLGAAACLVGQVGADAAGQQALDELAALGVDVSRVLRSAKAASGQIMLLVTPDGERTMFSYRGSNAAFAPEALDPELLLAANWLHLSSYALLQAPQRDAAQKLLDMAVRAGVRCSLDIAGGHAAGGGLAALLPRLDAVVLGLPEVQALLGIEASPLKAAQTLAERLQPGGVVGLKLGAQGCILASGSQAAPLPAFSVSVVDTTGAGDAFSAGLVYAMVQGLPLPAAAWVANALGALAASTPGAGGALPGLAELKAFVLRHPHPNIGDLS